MIEVRIENLSFAYSDQPARLILRDINVEVEHGEFVCILGQSGCGKSTLLRLLAGLEKPTEGSVIINEKQIHGAGLDRGVVFQDYGLFPWKTAGDNILLALRQKYPDKKKSELKEIALSMMRRVELDDSVYGKLPKALSGGMKQRCAIARALSLNPPILLMDEPFGALDAVTRAKLQDLLVSLWDNSENKKTVFFVTHDVDEALLLANRIIVLGQSPSHVIFDRKIIHEKRLSREEILHSDKMTELRHDLIHSINRDIMEHAL